MQISLQLILTALHTVIQRVGVRTCFKFHLLDIFLDDNSMRYFSKWECHLQCFHRLQESNCHSATPLLERMDARRLILRVTCVLCQPLSGSRKWAGMMIVSCRQILRDHTMITMAFDGDSVTIAIILGVDVNNIIMKFVWYMFSKALTCGVVIWRRVVNGRIQTFWIQPGSRYPLARLLCHLAQERRIGDRRTPNLVN